MPMSLKDAIPLYLLFLLSLARGLILFSWAVAFSFGYFVVFVAVLGRHVIACVCFQIVKNLNFFEDFHVEI